MASYEEHHAVAQLGEGGLLQLRHRRAHHRRLELEELGEAHLPEEDGALTLTLTLTLTQLLGRAALPLAALRVVPWGSLEPRAVFFWQVCFTGLG